MSKRAGPLPSVDEVLRGDTGRITVARFGHAATLAAVRAELGRLRSAMPAGSSAPEPGRAGIGQLIATAALATLEAADVPRLRRVFNLTGTVLHTNLGRAVLPEVAIAAASAC